MRQLFSGLSDFKVSGEERSQGTPATSTTNDIPNDDPNDDKEGAATWGSSISEVRYIMQMVIDVIFQTENRRRCHMDV